MTCCPWPLHDLQVSSLLFSVSFLLSCNNNNMRQDRAYGIGWLLLYNYLLFLLELKYNLLLTLSFAAYYYHRSKNFCGEN